MTGQLADFRRSGDRGSSFDAYIAMLDGWQLTGHDDEVRLGGRVS